MITSWDNLKYWNSGEWQWVQEKLDELDRAGVLYNPPRHKLFRSMEVIPVTDVRVAIFGQDPYPDRNLATGIAFSIPEDVDDYPPTLINIFNELAADLAIDTPTHGNLMDWVKQGVFLWNVYPSCANGLPGSHHWGEWEALTEEIVRELSEIVGVFVFLGAKARKFTKFIPKERIKGWNGKLADEKIEIPINQVTVLEYSHPSPLGVDKGDHPFRGSRMFSTINSHLTKPIDWRLNDGEWFYGWNNKSRSPVAKENVKEATAEPYQRIRAASDGHAQPDHAEAV